jgi:hypothetical protein
MLLDSNTLENYQDLYTDVCIIGAGVAGITAAKEFAKSRHDVIVLESGGEYPNVESQTLTQGRNSGLKYYDLDTTRVRAFGGTSLLWSLDLNREESVGVRLRDMDSIDFEKRDWIPNSGWPFTKKTLDPYYERAHKFCKIGPHNYDIEYWEDKSETPRLSFKGRSVETVIFQFADRKVFYQDYKIELTEAENIRVYLNATVLKIQLTEYANQVNKVIACNANGKNFNINAKYFILGLGGLEIPRLLLLSNDQMQRGIGNQHDLVGRYFMEHPHLSSGIFYPSNPELYKKLALYSIHNRHDIPVLGKLALSEDVLRREKLMNCAIAIKYKPEIRKRKISRSFNHLKNDILTSKINNKSISDIKNIINNFNALYSLFRDKAVPQNKKIGSHYDYKYDGFKLSIMSEQIPDFESRVELDYEKDRFGQQKLKLNWKLNPYDISNIRRHQEIIDRELRNNELGYLDIELKGDEPPKNITGGYHHMGTTRMSQDPRRGVVDENCRIHGVNNLFIASSSVFPTVGYANPTLTIIALTIRLADFIKMACRKPTLSL